jgi:UDP-N-acetylmuramate--alanine ligase
MDANPVFIDDYAHHPEELNAAIASTRALYPTQKITGIFQPHLFSRTRDFAEAFAMSLEALDQIILLDIYPAREVPIPGVSSELIFNRINHPNKALLNKNNLLEWMKTQPRPEVLLTLGAGDIDTLIEPLATWLRNS